MAAVLCRQGQHRRSILLLGFAGHLRETLSTSLPAHEQADYERCLADIRAALHPEDFDALWAEEQAMTVEQVLPCAFD